MAIAVTPLLDGSEFTKTNPGYESGRVEVRTLYASTRMFSVSGLTGSTDEENRMAATDADGIPQPQEEHPYNDKLWVTSVSAKNTSQTSCVVTVNYEQKPDDELPTPVIDIGSSQIASETAYDYAGNRITLVVDGKTYYGTVPFIKTGLVVRVSMAGYSFDYALSQCKEFNDTVSNGGPLGGAARTWLCQCSARPTGVGNTYTIDYEFSYNPNTWDAVATYSKDGIELESTAVTEATARKQVQVSTSFPCPELFL
jgi:hypothetical protein